MTRASLPILLAMPLALAAGAAWAQEPEVALLPGAGLETVRNNCVTCHSLDYIPMNSPFLTPKQWAAEVAKMRTLYGAPISDADAATIGAYLAATYAVAAP